MNEEIYSLVLKCVRDPLTLVFHLLSTQRLQMTRSLQKRYQLWTVKGNFNLLKSTINYIYVAMVKFILAYGTTISASTSGAGKSHLTPPPM